MTKHTPGPWNVAGKSGNPGEAFIIEAADRTVAWTANTLDVETEEEAITEEDRANARLIAAAPTMLDALKVIALDPIIRRWLFVHDPKALHQVDGALAEIEMEIEEN